MTLTVVRVTAADPALRALVTDQEAEVMRRYGVEDAGPGLSPDLPCLVAVVEGRAIGCVAVAPLSPGVGEIKRMYVALAGRGRGVGRVLLREAEALGSSLGYQALRLETGTEQPEAVQLYRNQGWTDIPCYGYFKDDPSTICMEKRL